MFRATSAVLAAAAALLAVSLTRGGGAAADDGPLPPPRAVPGPGPNPPAPGGRPVSGARLAPPGGEPRTSAVAVSSDYRLSPGDEVEIEISLPAASEADNPLKEPKRVLVAPGGTINLPKVRGLRLDGRSVGDVEGEIRTRLQQAGLGAAAEVFVHVTYYAPRFVFLVDALYAKIEVSPFQRTPVLHVLAQAGREMEGVDTSRIRVLAPSGAVRLVDVRALLASGASSPDAYLDPGDIVILSPKPPRIAPKVERIYVAGAVKAPGAFAYWVDEAKREPMTLLKSLAAAGWATEYGRLSRVYVRRFTEADPSARVVDVEAIIQGKAADLILQPDDFIWVQD